jgi:hypothetical protein
MRTMAMSNRLLREARNCQQYTGGRCELCRPPWPESAGQGVTSQSDDFGVLLVVVFQERSLGGVGLAGQG